MPSFGSRFLATLGVALLAFVAIVATANATTNPAPRRFVATFKTRYDADFNTKDELDVRIYGSDGKTWITYLCPLPTEASTSNATSSTDTWTSRGATCASAAPRTGLPRKAFEASQRTNYTTDDVLYVKTAGFLPSTSTTYRYKCVNPIETDTFYPDGISSNSSWAARNGCPVG
jgi:hypothetical protein